MAKMPTCHRKLYRVFKKLESLWIIFFWRTQSKTFISKLVLVHEVLKFFLSYSVHHAFNIRSKNFFKAFRFYSRLRRANCTHFSQIRYQSINTVKSLAKKFELLGSVQDAPRSGRSKTATNDEKVEEVRLLFENNAGH